MSNIYIIQAAELFFFLPFHTLHVHFVFCMYNFGVEQHRLSNDVTHAMVSKYNPVKEMPWFASAVQFVCVCVRPIYLNCR